MKALVILTISISFVCLASEYDLQFLDKETGIRYIDSRWIESGVGVGFQFVDVAGQKTSSNRLQSRHTACS